MIVCGTSRFLDMGGRGLHIWGLDEGIVQFLLCLTIVLSGGLKPSVQSWGKETVYCPLAALFILQALLLRFR